ncbi:MAG: F-box-like domain-containing protein [Parachlamydiales bacterium]
METKKLKLEWDISPPEPLPSELWWQIVSYTDEGTYLTLQRVCRYFRTIPDFWVNRCNVRRSPLEDPLREELLGWPNLKVLDLSTQCLNAPFIKKLKGCKNLKELVMRRCKGLDAELFRAVGEGSPNLTRLVVSYSKPDVEALVVLVPSLKQLKRLEVVECSLEDRLPALYRQCPHLQVSILWGVYHWDDPHPLKMNWRYEDPSQTLSQKEESLTLSVTTQDL